MASAARWRITRASPRPNGGSPVAAKRSVAPIENTSLAGVARSPRACSGAMYSGVPMTTSAAVSPDVAPRMMRDAEVGQVGAAGLVEQDVGRLDVAVHDAGAVGGGQRVEQRVGELADVGRWHRSPGDARARPSVPPER